MKHRKANWNFQKVNVKSDFSSMKYEEVNWNHDAAKGGEVPHRGIVLPKSAATFCTVETSRRQVRRGKVNWNYRKANLL
jgi:hypothetical protein